MTDTTTTKPDTVVRRLYARGRWKLDSVAHFGGDETGIADMCLLQDADGKPFIPGASIAGAARSFLARQSEPWTEYIKDKESEELKRLFGGATKDDTMSALVVADAVCVSKKITTSVRDGVRVDAQSGAAAAGAKFDVEVIERGTEFELNLACVIRHGDNSCDLTKLFLALLSVFQQGEIRLGARTRRGYGRGKVASWKIRDLCMNCPEDVMAWLRDDPWSRPKSCLTPCPLPDRRRYFSIEAAFELRTSLLIRSSSIDPDSLNEEPSKEIPDATHLHSNDKPVVPGTSFAGAFRHRTSLIAKTLGWKPIADEDADAVCDMFGPLHEQERDEDQEGKEDRQKALWASRVWIEEKLVKNVKPRWQDRVAIDRFTGGVVDGALFNEKPVYPLPLKDIPKGDPRYHLRLTLTLEEPDDAEIGLLLLTLRDFWHGHAALGGETSNGRGTLRGITAQLQFKRSASSDPNIWKFLHKDNRMTLDKGDAAFLKDCVTKAQCPPDCPPAGSRRPEKREGDR